MERWYSTELLSIPVGGAVIALVRLAIRKWKPDSPSLWRRFFRWAVLTKDKDIENRQLSIRLEAALTMNEQLVKTIEAMSGTSSLVESLHEKETARLTLLLEQTNGSRIPSAVIEPLTQKEPPVSKPPSGTSFGRRHDD